MWEENEFWIELSWRIDPDGALGIRRYFESRERPGETLGVDEYYGYIFENSVPGLPERASQEGLTPLDSCGVTAHSRCGARSARYTKISSAPEELIDLSSTNSDVPMPAANGRRRRTSFRCPRRPATPRDDARRRSDRRRDPSRLPDAER